MPADPMSDLFHSASTTIPGRGDGRRAAGLLALLAVLSGCIGIVGAAVAAVALVVVALAPMLGFLIASAL